MKHQYVRPAGSCSASAAVLLHWPVRTLPTSASLPQPPSLNLEFSGLDLFHKFTYQKPGLDETCEPVDKTARLLDEASFRIIQPSWDAELLEKEGQNALYE